ncbi:MAG: PP2C family serine/threonine-protein phosphatase [Gemmataceae bacterium]
MAGRWSVLHASVAGTSHQRRGQPCQDAAFAGEEGDVLVAACADGAGSAVRAEEGAKLACRSAVLAALSDIRGGFPLHLDRLRGWVDQARVRLSHEACVNNVPSRDYACTLLIAVVWGQGGLFAQVGDGAIVVRHNHDYHPIFWPRSGEYANQTSFLTDADFEDTLLLDEVAGPIDRLALFSDGLQRLALHEATRSVHVPFFAPLFDRLAAVEDAATLEVPLRKWLASDAVNQRTDDDKTLLLATRHDR